MNANVEGVAAGGNCDRVVMSWRHVVSNIFRTCSVDSLAAPPLDGLGYPNSRHHARA